MTESRAESLELLDKAKRIVRTLDRTHAAAVQNSACDSSDPAMPVLVGSAHAITRKLSDVKPESVTWLSPSRIPFGKLTVVEGHPGLGKSTVLLDLAARLTRGEGFPGDPPLEPADVILLTAEDGVADTVRPRLEAAGADCTRIHTLDGFIRFDGKRGEIVLGDPSDSASLEALENLIANTAARLVIVDVLTAFLSGERNSYSDHDIRGALRPLQALAERTGCAIVVVRHLRKTGGGGAITAGGGSIGIAGAARSVLLVDRDPADPERRVLASVKCNLGPPPQSISYRIVGAENGSSRIEWLGWSEHTAESLTEARANEQGEMGERSKTEECAECLEDWLTPSGMERKEVLRLGAAAGFSERTMDRARKLLGVLHKSTGYGSEKRSHWSLPSIPPAGTISDTVSRNPTAGRNGGAGGIEDCDEAAIEREAIQHEGQLPANAGD